MLFRNGVCVRGLQLLLLTKKATMQGALAPEAVARRVTGHEKENKVVAHADSPAQLASSAAKAWQRAVANRAGWLPHTLGPGPIWC